MTRANPQTPLRVNYPNRAQHVLEVGEWLAHPHEDNVVDIFTSRALNSDELVDDFVRGQVARETFQTAGTKLAPVRAAYLGRDTDRPTVRPPAVKRQRRRNQYRFDQISMRPTKQE